MLGFEAMGRFALGQINERTFVAGDAGTFTLTGIDVTLAVSALLTAELGSFAIIASDANLVWDHNDWVPRTAQDEAWTEMTPQDEVWTERTLQSETWTNIPEF